MRIHVGIDNLYYIPCGGEDPAQLHVAAVVVAQGDEVVLGIFRRLFLCLLAHVGVDAHLVVVSVAVKMVVVAIGDGEICRNAETSVHYRHLPVFAVVSLSRTRNQGQQRRRFRTMLSCLHHDWLDRRILLQDERILSFQTRQGED